jgi:molecular chaperone DnaK
MSDRVYGIDLGTTNSCLAVMDPDGPRAVAIDGDPIVPSVVSFDRDTGEVVVGRRARNRRLLAPESTIRSIKRRMGQEETVRLGGEERAPEAVAAEILRYLKVEGEKAEGREIRRAVITVPAYFEDAQRRATIRAGELAGLEVVRLLNEPTAAALVYDRLEVRGGRGTASAAGRRHGAGESERILVYDLGGGTFDVSVVEIRGELAEVRASCGDNHLGGDDFDELLVGHLLEHLRELGGRDLSADVFAMARLRAAAETAKIELSSQPYSRVMEEALAGDLHLDVELERATLEGLLEESLEGTLAEVDRALEEARLGAEQIDRVVLVGGSTLIPRVIEMLGERFGGPVEHSVDPALCVALGAAVQGALLGGELFDHILVDVAAHSLGIRTVGIEAEGGPVLEPDRFSAIIRRNTQIPVTRSELFHTIADRQKRYRAEVYQGEHPLCSGNTLIGEFPFDLEPAPAGSPVVVEFCYDLDGIVRVRVHQKGTDNRKEVTLDTRRRPAPADDGGAPAGDSAVDNYIIRKGRKLCGELPEGELHRRLAEAADAYEAALAAEAADPATVDGLEDELLELIEEAEELGETEGVY